MGLDQYVRLFFNLLKLKPSKKKIGPGTFPKRCLNVTSSKWQTLPCYLARTTRAKAYFALITVIFSLQIDLRSIVQNVAREETLKDRIEKLALLVSGAHSMLCDDGESCPYLLGNFVSAPREKVSTLFSLRFILTMLWQPDSIRYSFSQSIRDNETMRLKNTIQTTCSSQCVLGGIAVMRQVAI